MAKNFTFIQLADAGKTTDQLSQFNFRVVFKMTSTGLLTDPVKI